MFKIIRSRLLQKDNRTRVLVLNVFFSYLLKGVGIIVNLLYIPLLIDVLEPTSYGLWLTITSIVGWISFFDLGLGNGLRNKYAESKINGNIQLTREYVSTTFYSILAILISLWSFFVIISPRIDWAKLFNVNNESIHNISAIVFVIFTFFILQFALNIVTFILKGDQKNAISDLFAPAGNILVLAIIFFFREKFQNDLYTLVFILNGVPVLVLLIANIILFGGLYRSIVPLPKHYKKSHLSNLFKLSLRFFLIQIAGLIMFSSSNIIISRICSPSEVVIYNVAYKYFSVPLMLFSILVNPIWSAVTDAYHSGDYEWLKQTLRRVERLSILFVFGVLIMLFLSSYVFEIWIGNKIIIPLKVSIAIASFSILSIFFTPYSVFINGFGKLRLGTIIVFVKCVLFYPVTIFLTNQYGIVGMVVGIVMINSISFFVEPLLVWKVINKKANGIWNQ